MADKKKVVSPFLTIYKPQITSMFSIMERVTGLVLVVLIVGVIIMFKLKEICMTDYWFYSLLYTIFKSGGVIGVLVNGVIIYGIFNIYYHIMFGLRYMYWEKTGGGVLKGKERIGIKMELEEVYKSSYILIGIAGGLTVVSWLIIIMR